MTRRRLTRTLLATLALAVTATAAWAYWTTTGSGLAAASVGTLSAPAISVPSTSTGSIAVTWTAQASLPASPSQDPNITYVVQRRLGAGSYADLASGPCAGPLSGGTTSCLDSVDVSGSYSYRVVASFHTWTATSDDAGPVLVNTDVTPPTVSAIATADPTPTAASSLHWTVTFSEPVTGVDTGDFALEQSGVSGASISSVSGSGASYTVTVAGGSGSGTLGLDLADDDSIQDLAGNPLGGTGAGNGSFTGQAYTIDRTPPVVSSINRADPDPSSAATLHWTVTFSEAVTGVDASDFTFVRVSGAGGGITSVSGSGTTYTVTVDTGTGNATLGVNLTDDDSIRDLAGNPLAGAGAGSGNFTGQTYTIDHTAPTVFSINRADPSPSNATTLHWTVTFSEAVTGVDASDFVLTRTGSVSGGSISSLSGSGTTYTVAVSTGTGTGTLGLNLVDDDSILDAALNPLGGPGTGNGNTTGSAYTVDLTPPSVTSIVLTATSPTNAASVTWTVTFSESVTGVDATDFALAAGSLSGASVSSVSGSAKTYTVTAGTGSGSGSLGLNLVDDDTIKDSIGNRLGGTGLVNGDFTGQAYTLDRTAPQLTALELLDTDADGRVDQVRATFDEPLASSTSTTPWTLANAAGGATKASLNTSGAVATLNLTGAGVSTSVGSMTVALSASATGIRDALGNQASFAATAPTDRAGPVPTAIGDTDAGGTNGLIEPGDTMSITFSEPLDPASVASAPTITEARPASGNVTLSIPGITNGAISMGNTDYISTAGQSASFSATSALSNGDATVTITVGACTAGCGNVAAPSVDPTLAFAPSTSITDASGTANGAAGSLSTSIRLF